MDLETEQQKFWTWSFVIWVIATTLFHLQRRDRREAPLAVPRAERGLLQ
jgi:hypothetical protein